MVIFFLDRYSRPYNIGIYWEVSDFSSKTAGSLLSQSPCSGTFIATPSFNDSLRDPEHCHGLNVPNFKANIDKAKTNYEDNMVFCPNLKKQIRYISSAICLSPLISRCLSYWKQLCSNHCFLLLVVLASNAIHCHTVSYSLTVTHDPGLANCVS